MFKIFQKIFLGLIIVVAYSSAMGQVKFSASFTPSEIGKDEYATLRLMIENANDIGNITLPSLKDFTLAGGPNQESGMSTVNGVVNKYVALNYILQPRHTGTIVLPAATAILDGKKFTSAAIKLLVKKRGTTQPGNNSNNSNPFAGFDLFPQEQPREEFKDFILKKGELVPDKVNRNMQMVLQTSKSSCYVGEPIVASYKLYTRLKNESRLSKNPSFNGFSVIDLQRPDVTDYAREKLNGREYNVYTVRKAQLYPLQSGEIELEPAEMENKVQFLKEEALGRYDANSLLNDLMLDPDAVVMQAVTLSSKPVTINVKPLPEKDKPTSFNGAVGKFQMAAALDKNNFSSDESGKLTLVISGKGNLQLITAPDINWPQQFEAFEPKITDELAMTDVPVSGRKIFEIPFTVLAAGNYQLPAIEFSYFDPSSASYHILHTKPISFTVTKGTSKPAFDTNALSIKTEKSFSQKVGENRGWVVAVIALFIFVGLVFWLRYDSKKQKEHRNDDENITTETREESDMAAKKAEEAGRNPLQLSEDCLNSTDCSNFYPLLNQELRLFFAKRFNLPLQEVNAKTIGAKMDKEGMDNSICLQMQKLMQDIEWHLYGPFERDDTMREMFAESAGLTELVNRYYSSTP